MESFLLNKNDYFISNSYSIDNSLIYDIDKEQWKTTSIIKSELVIDSFMKKIEVLLTELFNYIYEFDDKNELNENIEESENYSLVPIENIHSSIINLLMPTPCSPSPFDKKNHFKLYLRNNLLIELMDCLLISIRNDLLKICEEVNLIKDYKNRNIEQNESTSENNDEKSEIAFKRRYK